MQDNFAASQNEPEPTTDQPSSAPVEPELTLREPTLSPPELSAPDLSPLSDSGSSLPMSETTPAPPDFSDPADSLETNSPLDLSASARPTPEVPPPPDTPLAAPSAPAAPEPISKDMESLVVEEPTVEEPVAEWPIAELPVTQPPEPENPSSTSSDVEGVATKQPDQPQASPRSTPAILPKRSRHASTWLPPAQSTLPSSSPPDNSRRLLLRCGGCCGCLILAWMGLLIGLYLLGSRMEEKQEPPRPEPPPAMYR